MKTNKVFKKWTFIVLALLLLSAMATYTYLCYRTTPSKTTQSQATIEVYSQYALTLDGKPLLYLHSDTTQLKAYFVRKYDLLPLQQGWILSVYDKSQAQDIYRGKTPIEVYKTQVDSLDKLCKDSQWKLHEIEYYAHSHQVMDEGYGMIMQYGQNTKQLLKRAKKMADSLHHARQDTARLKIMHSIKYAVTYRLPNGKMHTQSCLWQSQDKVMGMTVYRTEADTLLTHHTSNITHRQAAALIRTASMPMRLPGTLMMHIDSLGVYRGGIDSLYQRQGHGSWSGYDGSYYEGHWEHGHRDGFGFGIIPGKPLRVGEWRNDRYRGERLVYTSDRIYGIDISKYQHQQGKKHYAIAWNKLRISHLGSISKKTVSGNVSFPISFVYIKSTEGASLTNPYYRKDYKAARAHGFRVGSYHFFTTTPAIRQARQFVGHATVGRNDFPPVLDLEPTADQIKKMGGIKALFGQVRVWLRYVERHTGKRPILYISQTFVNRYLNHAPDIKANYKVWIARYGEYKPDIRLVLWQLCPDGRVTGIHGHVDINVFNGYQDAYSKFVKQL